MEIVGIVVGILTLLLGVPAAIVAVSQARSARTDRRNAETARNESRLARDEAKELALEANSFLARQAKAAEEANDLKRAEMVRPPAAVSLQSLVPALPEWNVENVSRSLWRVVNSGKSPAEQALVEPGSEDWVDLIRPEETEPRRVDPGDSLMFIAISVDQLDSPKIKLTWRSELVNGSATENVRIITIPV